MAARAEKIQRIASAEFEALQVRMISFIGPLLALLSSDLLWTYGKTTAKSTSMQYVNIYNEHLTIASGYWLQAQVQKWMDEREEVSAAHRSESLRIALHHPLSFEPTSSEEASAASVTISPVPPTSPTKQACLHHVSARQDADGIAVKLGSLILSAS